jgi:hypothetical protein
VPLQDLQPIQHHHKRPNIATFQRDIGVAARDNGVTTRVEQPLDCAFFRPRENDQTSQNVNQDTFSIGADISTVAAQCVEHIIDEVDEYEATLRNEASRFALTSFRSDPAGSVMLSLRL